MHAREALASWLIDRLHIRAWDHGTLSTSDYVVSSARLAGRSVPSTDLIELFVPTERETPSSSGVDVKPSEI
jgi:hypothetical protein